ncbi:MAG: PDZ domain-containing protein [Gaiellaceae bacterium]
MRRTLTPQRVVAVVIGAALATLVALYLIPSNDYLLLPDTAHPVAPLVRVQGGHDPRGPGEILFVDVFERRASVLESLFPSIRTGATLVPAQLIVPPGVTDAQVRQADLRAMSVSQRVAAAVALRQLGYKVVAKPAGVIVDSVELNSHAEGKIVPSDVVVSVDGHATLTVGSLRTALGKVKAGKSVTLGVKRGARLLSVRVQTIADPLQHGHAIVGFTPEQAATIRLPLSVQIDAGNVGGPSAGLAFALEVLEKLGHRVDRGYKVAATGQMQLDGTIAPIGGVEQKTYGVRAAHADVFLVPAGGDNAAEARRYAHGLRIIAVKSFPQALHALATLPPKR